ncbi:hypothetical protein [Paraclostridium dentum]|uniref:hypothetical protein n=1 Tax=Paraclostridium dentum TaxID=2662455 RepID=UPI0014743059|nr:hypothetical protein [Paraclostridium dentum]
MGSDNICTKSTDESTVKISDELDKENYRQLHNVVLNFSNNSIEIKKLCITAVIAVPTIFFNFFSNPKNITINLLNNICFILIVIVVLFYLVDVYTYYYQKKLRDSMLNIENNIRKRHKLKEKQISKNFFQKLEYRLIKSINDSNFFNYIKNINLINKIIHNNKIIEAKNIFIRLLASLFNFSHLIYYLLIIILLLSMRLNYYGLF